MAVEIKDNLQSNIVMIKERGQRLKNSQTMIILFIPIQNFLLMTSFFIHMIRNDKGEMGIEKINISDGNTAAILPLKNRILGFPVVKADTLLYSCSNNGRDEIWAYVNSQNKNYRLASYATGLYQASLTEDGKLVASAFTSGGYRLAKIGIEWQAVDPNDTLTNLYVTKPFNEKSNLLLNL